jgi:hypothetical protein
MTRKDIIDGVKKYFKLHELVGPAVFNAYGDDGWAVLQTDALHCLLIMREGIGKPFSVNNWYWGGTYDERGYRENISYIVNKKTKAGKLYTSGHVLACAYDFTVEDMSPDLVREWIVDHAEEFPCKVRLERNLNGTPITWVHFDTKYYERHPKVYLFDV